MDARFRLAVDREVVVEQDYREALVVVTVHEGVDYGDPKTDTKHQVAQLNLTKGQARAIASTIMGCAADL